MIFKHFRFFLRKFDHILLLVSLLFLVGSPIWEEVIHSGWFWTDIASILIIVSGLSITFSHIVKTLNFKLYLGFFSVLISIVDLFVRSKGVFAHVVQFSQVAYFLILTVLLFGLIFRAKKVDAEVLVNSVSGYLLLGLSWAIIIALWTNSYPNSFSFGEGRDNAFFNEVYFSFVTLTTLGYGDILPLTAPAKSISVLISITGAFYTTIVLGMIVGKFISNQSSVK